MVEATAEDYRFRLTVDASEAEKAARQFRQVIERELGRIDVGQMGGGVQQSTNGATRDLRKLEQELDRLSSVKLDLGLDELRQRFEEIGREARKLDAELQGMHFTGGSTGDTRYRAQVEDYYKNLARMQGDDAARLARNRGVVGNIGQIYSQHADDVRPVDEFSQRAFAEVQEKRRFSQEEQRRMLELEAQVYAAKLSETRTERALLERELQEAEQRTQGIELSEQTLPLFEKADQAYRRLSSESARLAQAEEEAASNLAETKRRLAIEAARQSQIGESGAPAGAVSTRTVISVSAKSADEAERLARALDEVAQAKERVAAITRTDEAALSREIEAERQKARIRAESARVAENLAQMERTGGEQARVQAQAELATRREAERRATIEARAGAQERQQAARAETHARIEAARSGRAHAVEEERRLTTAARAEAKEREQAARAEANEKIEQARIARHRATEEERRQTASFRAELHERERLARQQMQMQQSGAGGRGFGLGPVGRGVLTGLGAYMTVQGAMQLGRGAYDAGRTGAQDLRQIETFEALAKRVGVSAEGMQEAVKRASKSTIDDMTAIRLASQIMAQRFAKDVKDLEGDTEVLVQFARRASQIYTDESGVAMSAQDVFSRLVKFMREGNKELVDQFGLSNQLIADTLGIPLKGLASVDGAGKRWAGTVQILREEMERLGEAQDGPADKIERAEARISDSVDRLRKMAAEPIAFVVTMVAEGVEEAEQAIVDLTAINDERAAAMQRLYDTARMTQSRGQTAMIRRDLEGASAYGAQWKNYSGALDSLWRAEATAERRIRDDGGLSAPEQTERVRELLAVVSKLTDAYTDLQSRGQAGILDAGQLASAESQWRAIVAGVRDGSMSTDDAQAATERLTSSLRRTSSVFDFMIPQAADFADEMERAAGAIKELKIGEVVFMQGVGSSNPTMPGAAMGPLAALEALRRAKEAEIERINKERERERQQSNDARLEGIDAAGRRQQWAGADDAGKLGILNSELSKLTAGTAEYIDKQTEIGNLERQMAQEALRGQEKAQREWEQAAREVARKFEEEIGKVMSLPGLTSITPVTGEQMLDARFGVYGNQIDEWRRRAEDELITHYRQIGPDGKETLIKREGGQDWADVDPAQIRAMLGLPGDLPGDIVARKLNEAWGSGRLFADPANLGLIDEDALRSQYEQMKEAERGRANLRQHVIDTLGLSAADAALVTGTQSPLAAMLSGGQSEKEIMAQMPDVGAALRQQTLKVLESGGGYVEAFRAGLKRDIDQNIASLEPEIDRVAGAINGRLKNQIGKGILDAAIANAVASAFETFADGL